MHSTTVLALLALIICCVFSCSSADADPSIAVVPENHAAMVAADGVLERQKRAYGYGGRKKRGYGYRKKRDVQTAVGDPAADADIEGDLQLRQKRTPYGYGRGKRDILSVAPVGDTAVSNDGDIKLRQKRGYGYRKKRSYGYGRKKRGYGY